MSHCGDKVVKIIIFFSFLFVALMNFGSAYPKGTNLVFVSNEKSNTITVLDTNHRVIKNLKTCRRPRGMHFSADRTQFYVGCADDSQISIYDVASQKLVGRIRGVEEPETFDLHPNGRHLYISNEEMQRQRYLMWKPKNN